jgi:transcriptional regulator with XRE-family HTH domain
MIRQGGEDAGQAFGDRVRMSRERLRTPDGRRWTQGDLAKALDVKRNTVSRWENGGMLPKDPAVIASLSRVLHVSADWLLAGFGEPEMVQGSPGIAERPETLYNRTTSAESLPEPAADIVLRYVDRLVACGCSPQQAREAERLLVAGARNVLARRPFGQREMKEVIGDIDAAWDFVTHVLRRQGIRP